MSTVTGLQQRKAEALSLLSTLAIPSKRHEAWRRTSLEGLEPEQYKHDVPASVELKGNLPAGVIFTNILTAIEQHGDLVAKFIGTLLPHGQDKLAAAQSAHLNGGFFLYVPKNVTVEEPLQVVYNGKAGEALYLHALVVTEANASVTVLEQFEGEGEYLHVGVAEVFTGEGSRVRFGYLQNHSEDAWSVYYRRAKTGRDSSLDWVGGEFGGGVVRSELIGDINGVGSNSTIKVVFGASGNQHIDIVASQVHTGNNSGSDILGRGVLTGKAHSVFRGNGQINKGALNCSTYQRQQALVLSDKARADEIPALIINEHEVEGAGHAATVGKLDEEQLFYLMARGLSRKEATTMLVLAFLSPVLDQIPVEALRDEMTKLMAEKVNG
ncbi:MAG TPA: Fe-S cluster assembly protein SufD [Symbiobacteriaceae bacterium]|nr:Fe-S cluster assembly protein SufD [Symbiobacteriaceae bacterium]